MENPPPPPSAAVPLPLRREAFWHPLKHSALHKPKNPGYLLQGIRGFPLKKRIKMKRTVSCRFYITGNLLTNPTSFVTKGLNPLKIFLQPGSFLAFLYILISPEREKGQRSDPSAFPKMEDRMKRCSCLASMSIDKRFYKSSRQLLQKL